MSFFVIILYIKAILVQGIFFDTYSISLFGYSFGILFFFIAKYLHLKIVALSLLQKMINKWKQ